jgi:hypothetical protein
MGGNSGEARGFCYPHFKRRLGRSGLDWTRYKRSDIAYLKRSRKPGTGSTMACFRHVVSGKLQGKASLAVLRLRYQVNGAQPSTASGRVENGTFRS